MSLSIRPRPRDEVEYPDSDGEPMAENTLQFEWIVVLKDNLDRRLDDFVAGDLLWYPVEGRPEVRRAPDTLVALGRPKGYRGSYKQWEEAGIAPQVVFEVLSPGNTITEMQQKYEFYRRYGVEEYYIYDPDKNKLEIFVRKDEMLIHPPRRDNFVSPLLGIRFDMSSRLVIYDAEDHPFETFAEISARAEAAEQRADHEKQRADQEQQRADHEQQRAEAEKQRAEAEKQRAEEAEAQIKALKAQLAKSTGA